MPRFGAKFKILLALFVVNISCEDVKKGDEELVIRITGGPLEAQLLAEETGHFFRGPMDATESNQENTNETAIENENDGEKNETSVGTTKPGQDDTKKIFVAGLTSDTSEQQIKDHFSQFGEVLGVTLKFNTQTAKSKGYAFVVFSTEEAMDAARKHKDHKINDKPVDVKKARVRPGKVFVGGIKPELTEEDIKEHFKQFGNVTAVDMPFDKTKNQRRTFCFVTFESDLIIRSLLKTPKQKIKDVYVDVKMATPQQDSWGQGGGAPWGPGGWGQGGYGPSGGGYGDWYGYDSYGGYGGPGYGGYTDFGGYGPSGGYGGGPGGYGGPGYGGSPGGFGGEPGRGRGRGRGARQKPY